MTSKPNTVHILVMNAYAFARMSDLSASNALTHEINRLLYPTDTATSEELAAAAVLMLMRRR